MLFSSVFFYGFWRGLELILGRVWGPFGVSWVTFGDNFWCLYFNLSPKELPEPLGIGFGLIFHDLEANFGSILALFWPNFGSILASNHCVLAKWKSFLKYYHQTKGWRGSYSKWWWNHVMRCQKHFVMVITNAISVASIVYQQKFDIYYMHSSKRPLSMQTLASVPTSQVILCWLSLKMIHHSACFFWH